jgi:cytoskeleton protein RodZ
MANFGASFKKARDAKGVSIAKIAEETRISSRFLEAIENEDFHLLPGGIFNRGFIRTYAERVGLDPDAALSEYEQLIKTHEPEQQVAFLEEPVSSKGQKNFYPVVIGALALAIVIFYIVTRDSGNAVQTRTTAGVTASEPAPSTPLTPSVEAAPEPEPEPPPPAISMALEVQAIEQTWIKVVTDNEPPQEALMEPGNVLRFTAQTSLTLTLGNAAGVTLTLNDQPMKPLGRSGQVREVVITPDSLKDFIG